MDLNDPRRRLQVMQQQNPSIRATAAPELKIAAPAPQARLFVGNQQIESTPETQRIAKPTTSADTKSNVSKIFDFANAAGERFGTSLARDLNAIPGFVRFAKPVVPKQFDHYLDTVAKASQSNDETFLQPNKEILARSKAGDTFGTGLKIASDVTQLAAAGVEGVADIAKLANKVSPGGKVANALGKIPFVKNPAAELRAAVEGNNIAEATKLISETSNKKLISKVLNVDDDMAAYLAAEKNPTAVQAVLETLGNADDATGGMKVFDALNPDPNWLPEGYAPRNAAPEIPTNLPDEDIAAIKAAGGTVPEVTATSAFHIPATNSYAKLTPEQLAFLKNETGNIPFSAGDMPHLTPVSSLERAGAKEITLDELTAASPNAKKALENFKAEASKVTAPIEDVKPVTQAAKAEEAVAELKPQSGVSTPEATGNVTKTVDTPATTDAKTAFPDADPDAQKAIQEVMDSLSDAERGYSLNEKVRSAEKASRAAAGKAAYEAAGGGEAGVRAKLSKLKGKYSESGFNPIQATPEAQTKILDTIEKSGLRDFEKLNTQNALRKVWGAADGKPTPSDISYIRDFFGDEMANAVETAVKEGGSSWQEKLAAIASTPKSAMATADLSAPLRQGGVLGTRFPKEWATAAKDSVKYFASDEAFQRGMAEIKARPNFDVYKKMGLSVDAAEGLAGTEEEFMSSLLESKVLKGNLGKVTAASDRGYSGFLTKLRADVADKILTDVQKAGVELDDKALESLGKFINSASGRGDLGSLEKHAGLLSKALFSPRLWKSRLDLLNPVYYAKLDPVARKYALQSSASFAATAATVLGLATAAGATVEWNPTSADFAKIKVGNTRYDILGGLQQNIVLGMRLVSGKKTNSETGEVTELNKGFAKSRGDILLDFAKNKANPLIGYADKVLNDSNDGSFKDINPLTEAGKLVTPLNFMGIADTAKDVGSLPKGAAMSVPGFGGVGVQTYGTTATKDKGAPNAQGVPSFKGKVTEDMVLDSNGTPILDDKGKPVKVKFDKDASDVEKQAQLKKAQSTALGNVAKRLMSKEDAGIYKLGQADKNSLDETQLKKYNQLQKYVQNYGKSIDTPKGADSAPAKTFYQKFNSMSKEDQDSWLKEAPDDNAKTITAALNKQRASGLSEYKPSNAISKAYAEYEKDLNTHPEYTNIDKRNKAKSFQTTVYKLNYSENQRDIYSEGPSDDLKTLIANKDIDKEDLDNAIKMDNELYASGLTGSLKFTKKFRASMGYATPASKDGTGGGDTKKAYLSNLLPSFSTGGSSSAKPEFSSRSRKPTLKSNASTKGASNSKKISINL